MALSVAQAGNQSLCTTCARSFLKEPTLSSNGKPAVSFGRLSLHKECVREKYGNLESGRQVGSRTQSLAFLSSTSAGGGLSSRYSVSRPIKKRQLSVRAEQPTWSQGTTKDQQGSLTLVDVRLTLAPVEDLIPVSRRLPAPKDIGVYALVPTTSHRRDGSEESTSGLQRMSREDAMGFALGAATGNRSGPIDGPGWTLLDPAAALGSKTFSSAGPLLTSSPRRTLRVEFTCNKCWERTIRAINPQAYKTGTVFVQCKGCNVYHKLVDNLNLFHELKGPIYSPPGQLFHTPYDPFKAGMPGGFDGLPFQ